MARRRFPFHRNKRLELDGVVIDTNEPWRGQEVDAMVAYAPMIEVTIEDFTA